MVCQELTAPFQDTSPLFTLSIPQWRKGGSLKQNLTLHLTGIKASWGQTQAMGIKKGLFTLPAAATWATINIQPLRVKQKCLFTNSAQTLLLFNLNNKLKCKKFLIHRGDLPFNAIKTIFYVKNHLGSLTVFNTRLIIIIIIINPSL